MYVDNNTINVMVESNDVDVTEILSVHSDISEEDLDGYYLRYRCYCNIDTKEVGKIGTYM